MGTRASAVSSACWRGEKPGLTTRERARRAACLLSFAALIAQPGCEPSSAEIPVTPIKIISETPGLGPQAVEGDEVCIDYRLMLPDGRVLLSDEEFCFMLGAGAVIEAVDEGVDGMRLRGRRAIEVPPHKHWGRVGYGDGAVPPATNLLLEITLKEIR